MSDEMIPIPENENKSPFDAQSWISTWIKALTSPNEEAYVEIVNDPGASVGKAYLWLFASGVIGSIIFVLFDSLFSVITGTDSFFELFGFGIIFFACGFVFFPLIGVTIYTGISHGIAKLLGGEGDFGDLIYAVAAYTAPIGIVSNIIGSIPFVNLLSFPIGLYALVLNVVSIKAVHNFSWGKAAAASLILLVLIFVGVACCMIVFLAVLGPAIGDVFTGILNDIGP